MSETGCTCPSIKLAYAAIIHTLYIAALLKAPGSQLDGQRRFKFSSDSVLHVIFFNELFSRSIMFQHVMKQQKKKVLNAGKKS